MPAPKELVPSVRLPEGRAPIRSRPHALRYAANGGCGFLVLGPMLAGAAALLAGGEQYLGYLGAAELVLLLIWLRSLPGPRRRRRRGRLRKRLHALGFETDRALTRWVGVIGGHRVEVQLEGGAEVNQALRVRGLPGEGEIRAELDVTRDLQGRSALGDLKFDALAGVRGPLDEARAALRWPTRLDLGVGMRLNELRIEAGAVLIPLLHVRWMKVAEFEERLTHWAGLASQFVRPADALQARLAAVARDREEPPAVRAGAFMSLAPQPPYLLEALLAEKVPPLSVCLGELLGAPLRDPLAELIDTPQPDLRLRAFEAWRETLPASERGERLAALLSSPWANVRAAALTRLAELRHPIPELDALLADEANHEVQLALAAWADRRPDAEAERVAIALCAAEALPVLEAATTLLGRVGTVTAIAPLVALEDRSRTRRAARDALALIRARLPNKGSAGDLVLLDEASEAGGLALAESGLALVDEGEPSEPL